MGVDPPRRYVPAQDLDRNPGMVLAARSRVDDGFGTQVLDNPVEGGVVVGRNRDLKQSPTANRLDLKRERGLDAVVAKDLGDDPGAEVRELDLDVAIRG